MISLHKTVPGNACVRSTRPTTISLHKVAPGNACVRSTQITGSPLRQRFLYTWRSLAMRACVTHKQQGRLCSRPTTISLHMAVPGNACVRSTQTTGSSLQSTDNDFSPQGGPWQCVSAFHTNNRVTSATTISLHTALPGNACVRSTQITGSPLQSPDHDFSTHGGLSTGFTHSTQADPSTHADHSTQAGTSTGSNHFSQAKDVAFLSTSTSDDKFLTSQKNFLSPI